MKRLRDESGQALIITALCMTCLFGFAALATDVGIMLNEKRILQIAADSAAIAGAAELKYGNATTAAQAAATQNGFTNGTGGATVTVNGPPTGPLNGPHANQPDYVEVIVSQVQPTLFMGFFGISSLKPTARAVAWNGGPSSGCIYTLAPSGRDIDGSGGASLTDPECGIIVNSASNNAVNLSGGATINAKSVGIVGRPNTSGGATITPPPVLGIVAVSDPLVFLQPGAPSYNPATLSCASGLSISGGKTQSAAPSGPVACYNGISVSGGSTLTITNPGVIVINGDLSLSGNSTVNFGAGLYYTTGQFSASGGNTASGTDVTFFAASPNGSFNLSGGVNLNLTAPTSGNNNGILFWQAQGNVRPLTMSGGSSSVLKGIIYAPSARLTMSGGAGSTLYTDLVVSSMNLSGNASLLSYAAVNANTPLTSTRLVE